MFGVLDGARTTQRRSAQCKTGCEARSGNRRFVPLRCQSFAGFLRLRRDLLPLQLKNESVSGIINGNPQATEKDMKIHIIGGPGSGKSFLAETLSKQLGIAHYDLDDLQWDNAATGYGIKRDPKERDALLTKILKQDDWIIEGVYYAWCLKCFEDADQIHVLEVPRRTYRSRIIRRFLRRKFGLEKGKKETLQSLKDLLKWADRYQKKNLVEIRKILEAYPDKVIT